ncbi:MAG: TonB-dependent receptor plug domain-containing protein [Pedobacter sp.]|jgi:TonB-dependent SusC/RagA subfamily outer membrane receptor|uniref:TonB-dependent receptor plug domain-containing protein n=1 Tax=Pedobacter sp. TaxID=1411316 RepID=UPI003562886A
MKKLIYVVVLGLACSFQSVNAQETSTVKGKIDSLKVIGYSSTINITGNSKTDRTPLVVLDGKIIEYNSMNAIDPNKIAVINILKDASAIAQYGESAKNGAIIISTKDYVPNNDVKIIGYGSNPTFIIRDKFALANEANRPLVIVNDEIIGYDGIKGIDPNKIRSVSILKDVSATALYGQPAKNGVIIISTKDYVPKKAIK